MRDLSVPRDAFDVIGPRCGIAQAQRVLDVVGVVNVELALVACGRDDLRLDRVELKRLDGATVLRRARNEYIDRSGNELLGIP